MEHIEVILSSSRVLALGLGIASIIVVLGFLVELLALRRERKAREKLTRALEKMAKRKACDK